jgi:hypothetical protein
MRRLVLELMKPEKGYSLDELAKLCEEADIFERFTALRAEKPNSFRTAFSRFLCRYDKRRFARFTFQLAGTSHNRTYQSGHSL